MLTEKKKKRRKSNELCSLLCFPSSYSFILFLTFIITTRHGCQKKLCFIHLFEIFLLCFLHLTEDTKFDPYEIDVTNKDKN